MLSRRQVKNACFGDPSRRGRGYPRHREDLAGRVPPEVLEAVDALTKQDGELGLDAAAGCAQSDRPRREARRPEGQHGSLPPSRPHRARLRFPPEEGPEEIRLLLEGAEKPSPKPSGSAWLPCEIHRCNIDDHFSNVPFPTCRGDLTLIMRNNQNVARVERGVSWATRTRLFAGFWPTNGSF